MRQDMHVAQTMVAIELHCDAKALLVSTARRVLLKKSNTQEQH